MPPQLVNVPPPVLENYLKEVNLLEKQCMFCGTIGQYHVNPIIYEIRPFFQGGLALGGGIPTVPVILIHCQKCGDTRQISTIITQMTPKVMIQKQAPASKNDPLDGR